MEKIRDEENNKWKEYIEKTKDKPPKAWLVGALAFVDKKEEALDLGPGAFNETKFLLSEGFKHITAVDISNAAEEIYDQLPKDKVKYIILPFKDFNFPKDTFDLVNAQYSLPFNPPDTFDEVFDKVKNSLKKNGIFTGQFFGKKHGWNIEGSNKSFHTEEQVKKLLSDMEILEFKPEEEDKKPVIGELVYWDCIPCYCSKKTVEIMNYLYHRIPKNMKGNILYPLNMLKKKYPDAYEDQVGKYIGREHIMKQRIPMLDCLWNDVLHLSPVHPSEIKKSLIESGNKPDFILSCYQIDPTLIDVENAIIYLYSFRDRGEDIKKEDFISYSISNLGRLSSIPQATKEYYKEIFSKDLRPLLYHRIPHVLYKSSLDITSLPTISV